MKILKNLYVIEGINGVGKTTVVSHLKEIVKTNKNFKFIFVKFPSDEGKQCLNLMSWYDARRSNNLTASLIHYADINETFNYNVLRQMNLNSNCKFICDRYIFSNMVYRSQSDLPCVYEKFYLPEKVFYIYTTNIEAITKRLSARLEENRDYSMRLLKSRDNKYRTLFSTKFKHISTMYIENDDCSIIRQKQNAKLIYDNIIL